MNQSQSQDTDFDELFALILNENGAPPISKLYQLSDMPQVEFEKFMTRWPQVSPNYRAQIARHMADISEENFVVDFSPFAEPFLKDEEPAVRLAALDMLWDSTDTSLIEPIIYLMANDKDDAVRASAAATLGHYMLMIQWGEINQKFEAPVTAALLTQINHGFTPKSVRRAALESISSSGAPEVPELIRQAYASGDPQMKLSAIFAMGRSADERWSQQIANELESDEPEMRVEASRAAGILGQSDYSEKLAHIALNDDHLEAQIAAIYALGQIGNDTAVRTLDEISNSIEYEDLHEIAEEAMEEMMIMGLDIDLSLIDWEADDDDDVPIGADL